MKTAILLASAATATTSYVQNDDLGNCWNDCTTGSCEDFCGEGGFCCGGVNHRKGFENVNNRDCPQAAIDAITANSMRCAVPVQPPKQFYIQDGGLGYCWKDCGNKGGSCDDFCGEGGYCCGGVNNWKGIDNINNRNCPQEAIDAIVATEFRCAIPSEKPDPDQVYEEGDQGYCWDTCKGGSCESFCGKGGYCCGGVNNWKGLENINNGNCPQNAIDAVTANEYRCAVPVDDTCKPSADAEALEDDDYKIIPAASANTFNWNKARKQCKSYGKHWDLVIFNSEREFSRIKSILEDNCVNDQSYWIGYKENDGKLTTQYDQKVPTTSGYGATTSIMLPWAEGEPNDNLGDEKCVRYNAKEGTVNDAICGRTWTGAAKDGIGMGIICEKHNPCEQDRGDQTVEWENKK